MTFSPRSFTLGMLGGILIGAFLFADKTFQIHVPMPEAAHEGTTTASESVTHTLSGALSVENQPSGNDVLIESVTVPTPGVWVAVREMNGGVLGNILGAARVKGPSANVVVNLLRPTEPERSYTVMLYRADNSDVFDPAINSVYVDYETGERVSEVFSTTE